MTKIDTTEQRELFEAYKKLGHRLDRNCLGYIIQNDLNDFPATREEIEEWLEQCRRFRAELTKLEARTYSLLLCSQTT